MSAHTKAAKLANRFAIAVKAACGDVRRVALIDPDGAEAHRRVGLGMTDPPDQQPVVLSRLTRSRAANRLTRWSPSAWRPARPGAMLCIRSALSAQIWRRLANQYLDANSGSIR
jgi:hypothetical protein